uniref:Putative secreted protein n=1 Tax=Anopheles marajoara TaxID=58244 RepID=A0A2M4CD21_9DIPT
MGAVVAAFVGFAGLRQRRACVTLWIATLEVVPAATTMTTRRPVVMVTGRFRRIQGDAARNPIIAGTQQVSRSYLL